MALAYIDFEQQEFAIGAALSGDKAMQDAYRSSDPYLAFAKQAGAVPADATKASHKAQRELFKLCALGVQYGMGAESLARRMGKALADGRELLRLHRATYPVYWGWSDAVQDFAMLRGYLETVFGWRVQVGPDANPRSLRNFPLQANGAEMLRLACCLATERGIGVCAPIHDALLVEGPAGEIGAIVSATQAAMREASELVLPGFPLRTEAKVVKSPDRYTDDRGRAMWELVWSIIGELGGAGIDVSAGATLPVAPALPPLLLFSLLLTL
jgi:DNA polymerase I-like protein with 3'-5' exonuclease and polymerase domains